MFTDEELEKTARRLCLAHGLDADESVLANSDAEWTVAERHGAGPCGVVMVSVPRWRLFRHEASRVLAAAFALRNKS